MRHLGDTTPPGNSELHPMPPCPLLLPVHAASPRDKLLLLLQADAISNAPNDSSAGP